MKKSLLVQNPRELYILLFKILVRSPGSRSTSKINHFWSVCEWLATCGTLLWSSTPSLLSACCAYVGMHARKKACPLAMFLPIFVCCKWESLQFIVTNATFLLRLGLFNELLLYLLHCVSVRFLYYLCQYTVPMYQWSEGSNTGLLYSFIDKSWETSRQVKMSDNPGHRKNLQKISTSVAPEEMNFWRAEASISLFCKRITNFNLDIMSSISASDMVVHLTRCWS